MKNNNFRGELTDNSAKKEALVPYKHQNLVFHELLHLCSGNVAGVGFVKFFQF